MRRLNDATFRLIIKVYAFVNNSRVKTVGSIVYAVCAILFSFCRNQLQVAVRVALQSPVGAQLRMLALSSLSNVTTLIQKAQTMFQ